MLKNWLIQSQTLRESNKGAYCPLPQFNLYISDIIQVLSEFYPLTLASKPNSIFLKCCWCMFYMLLMLLFSLYTKWDHDPTSMYLHCIVNSELLQLNYTKTKLVILLKAFNLIWTFDSYPTEHMEAFKYLGTYFYHLQIFACPNCF